MDDGTFKPRGEACKYDYGEGCRRCAGSETGRREYLQVCI